MQIHEEREGAGVALCDLDLRFQTADRRFLDSTGYASDNLIGRSLLEIQPTAELDSLQRAWDALRTGAVDHCLVLLQWPRADGSLATLPSRLTALRNVTGQPVGLAIEIEESRRAAPREERFLHLVQLVCQVTGREFFTHSLTQLLKTLEVKHAYIARKVPEREGMLETVEAYRDRQRVENFSYSLEGTPCAMVLEGVNCVYPRDVAKLFPKDMGLQEWGVESYLGVPVYDNEGRVIGLLAILDEKPLNDPVGAEILLRICAARAGAELARHQAQEQVETRNHALALGLKIASKFLDAPADEAAHLLQESLVEIRKFLGVDRGFSLVFSRDGQFFYSVAESSSQHVPPCAISNMKFYSSEWDSLISRLRMGRLIAGEVAEIPVPPALGRAPAFPSTDAAVVAIAPQVYSGQLAGALVLESCNPARVWTPEDREAIEIFSDVFTHICPVIHDRDVVFPPAHLKMPEPTSWPRQSARILQEPLAFTGIVGEHPKLIELLRDAAKVALTDTTVLILGETGTGKELVARAIHGASLRRMRPLITLNCGAIPQELVESELFGHERGAFSGALVQRLGRFEVADGGTVFLDEIGELPAPAQAKLLRVLAEGELTRVGSNESRQVDVRVIAATNRDLEEEVEKGRFRADLFYRLHVVPLWVPPLRERVEDIPLIASHFLQEFAQRLGRHFAGLTPAALEWFQSYSWPGNVRELANLLERAAVLSDGPLVDVPPPEAMGKKAGVAPEVPAAASPMLRDVERTHILRVLRACGWTIEGPQGAARLLGLAPSTLRSRIRKLGIERPPVDREDNQ